MELFRMCALNHSKVLTENCACVYAFSGVSLFRSAWRLMALMIIICIVGGAIVCQLLRPFRNAFDQCWQFEKIIGEHQEQNE